MTAGSHQKQLVLLTPREEFIRPLPEDAEVDDELVLHDLEAMCSPPWGHIRSSYKLPLPDEDRQQIERAIAGRRVRQFSIFDMLALTTFVAIGFSAATWLPMRTLAGVLGLAAVAAVAMVTVRPPQSRVLHLAWLTLVIVYLAAVVLAVFGVSVIS